MQGLRSCIACKNVFSQKKLVRFFAKEHNLCIDSNHYGKSRGCYVCSVECFDKAVEGNLFARALRQKIKIDCKEDLRCEVQRLQENN